MSNNVEGFEYEERVIESLKVAGYCGDITQGAGSSAADADADLRLGDEKYLVEVKKDGQAQMGGTSVRFTNGEFEVTSGSVESVTAEMIMSALEPKKEAIEAFLSYIGAEQFPTTCEKDAWESAKVAGLLKEMNAKISRDTSFISDHYKSKGIYYIQIGGAGLFYLSENPANLPVPKLEGKIDIELRAGRSGSKKNAAGVSVVSGLLRAQGRLKFQGQSPYTLDDPDSVKAMIVDWAGERWSKVVK